MIFLRGARYVKFEKDSKMTETLEQQAERQFADCMLRIAIAGDYFELLMVKLNVWRV